MKTIIIVDDEASIRNGIRHIMNWEEHGFQILADAKNGIEALEKIGILRPDIVITDLKMPKMDGIELSIKIKKDFPEIRLLVLSSYDDFHSVSQSFKNGAVDYILKPTLTKDNLLECLNKIILREESDFSSISKEIILREDLNRFLSGFKKNNIGKFSDYLGLKDYYVIYCNLSFVSSEKKLNQYFSKIEEADFVYKSIEFKVSNIDKGLIVSVSKGINIKKEFSRLFLSYPKESKSPHIIISECTKNMEEVFNIYKIISSKSSEQLFFFKKNKIIFQEEFFQLNEIEKFDISIFLTELLDNNFLLSLVRIETYFNNLILSIASPRVMKQQASSIFYTYISRVEEEYPNIEELYQFKIVLIQTINQLNYLEDFSEFILKNILQLRVILNKYLSLDDSTLVQIKEYIMENYKKNLSLADVAKKFHFSYNYLSVFLSGNLQMSFPDYLKKIRMNEALKLLSNTELTLSEISLSVGYSDLSYFSNTFKKEFNMTPSKYRRSQNIENNNKYN